MEKCRSPFLLLICFSALLHTVEAWASPLSNSLIWDGEQHISPSDGNNAAHFGFSVALEGDVFVVGALNDATHGEAAGAAYVFVYDGTAWVESQKLTALDGSSHDHFGTDVAIEGDTIMVGAPGADGQSPNSGAVYLFQFNGSTWSPGAKLTAQDGQTGDELGQSVSFRGDLAVFGAPGQTGSAATGGYAYIFEHGSGGWYQSQKIIPSDVSTDMFFGTSVAAGDGAVLVGAPGAQASTYIKGAAYSFVKTGSSWGQSQKLVSAIGNLGDLYGWDVAMDSTHAVISSPVESVAAFYSGAVHVFEITGSGFTSEQILAPGGGFGWCNFGRSVSLDGQMLAVGSADGVCGGAVYSFIKDGGMWTDLEVITPPQTPSGQPGREISLQGNKLVGGDFANTGNGTGCGAVYAYGLFVERGEPCSDGFICQDGHCADGVCCDDICGGNVETDCWVCSEASGADEDGVCTRIPAGTPCDDGYFCTMNDVCQFSGGCIGSDSPCPGPDGDDNCVETCNEMAEDCSIWDPDGAQCDDGDSDNGPDVCMEGICVGGIADTDGGVESGDSGSPEDGGREGCECRFTGSSRGKSGLLAWLLKVL